MFDSTDATGEKRRRYSGTPPQMPATFDAVDLRLAARSLTLLLSLSLGSGCGSRSALLTGDSPSTTSTGTTTGSTSAAAHYWSRTLPAGYAMTVASDAGGNVFLSSLCGDVDLAGNQAGIDRFCLAKLDPDGTLLWSRVFFGTGSTIRVDASENLWIAGYFKGTIDLGGGPLQSAYEMNDLFVAKLDPQGNHLFSARFGDEGGGDGTQLPGQLVTLPQGGVVLVGVFDGTLSFGGDVFSTVPSSANGFIARFDDKGDHVWSRALSDTPTLGYAAGAAVLPDGSVAVTGTYFAEMDCGGELLPDQGFGDIVVLKLDAEGKQVFCRSLGGPNEESGARIVATPDGGFWLTGYFAGPLPFGATELTPAGVNNGYLGRLGPDGGPVSAPAARGGRAEHHPGSRHKRRGGSRGFRQFQWLDALRGSDAREPRRDVRGAVLGGGRPALGQAVRGRREHPDRCVRPRPRSRRQRDRGGGFPGRDDRLRG